MDQKTAPASTATAWDRHAALIEQRHAEQVERGEHDDRCEWGPSERLGRPIVNYICHCSKRRREAEGYTTPPGPLIHNAPSCPRCFGYVDHDGDVWVCVPCCVSWHPDDPYDHGQFTDDHGAI